MQTLQALLVDLAVFIDQGLLGEVAIGITGLEVVKGEERNVV